MTTDPAFASEAHSRLTRTERRGLRLAIACRTAIAGVAFAWYLGAAVLFTDFSTRFGTLGLLMMFTVVGIAHLCLIGTRFDRWWMKYAVYALDALTICALFALVPISRADDVPQIIAFRAYGIYYLFPLLAMACLSLSWRLVLWTGFVCCCGWWAAFLWVSAGMANTLSWADIPTQATRADYETVFLSINFIGRGNRIEETAMLMFAALALALAVYRARAVFFAQVAADLASQRERAARERVSGLLEKYVPEEIAQRLIASEAPLQPQQADGTVLVMDIAGFTRFSANHAPDVVIARLDAVLTDAARTVADAGGIVISYLGDGFLVTFNAPVAVANPARAALDAAQALLPVGTAHGFDLRIGIASGPLVSGIIGSDQRQSFTVYGDTVNLAARLEQACKVLSVPICTHAATRSAAGVPLTDLGTVPIRGLDAPIPVYGIPAHSTQD